MQLSDIIHVPLTPDDYFDALKRQMWLDRKKNGAKTRDAFEDKNIVGELAHMAVEKLFDEIGLEYYSSRKEDYARGDQLDIAYNGRTMDVKGTHGVLNEKWFFNKEFLVFNDQVTDPKFLQLDDLCFVQVNPLFTEAWVYGVIEVRDFISEGHPVKLRWDNWGIQAHKLTPFREWQLGA